MQGDWFSPDWVPLFQTLTWAGLILLLLGLFWKRFALLVEIVIRRIEAGSSFKAGPVEVGAPPSVKATSDQIGVTAEGKSGSD